MAKFRTLSPIESCFTIQFRTLWPNECPQNTTPEPSIPKDKDGMAVLAKGYNKNKMNTYRYILDKSSKKHQCPYFNKKRFVRFIDTETGEYLPDQYGRCDRESNCSYYLDPYTDGYAKKAWQQENGQYNNDWKPKRPPRKAPPPKPELYLIPYEVLKSTQSGYERNLFIQNLLTRVAFPFDVNEIEKAISLYQLGTVPGSGTICFPYIDKMNCIRAIQEKIFDKDNHTDETKKYNSSWIHARLKYTVYRNQSLPQWLINYEKNDGIVSCLFGEHLLTKYPNNPVALVEAPKTAIYGTLYFGFPEQPQNLLWMAVYNLSSLNFDRCKVLEGRDVILFPDLSMDGNAYEIWSSKAKTIQRRLKDTRFKVSDLLERLAPEHDRKEGNDIADYLIKLDWREFRKQGKEPIKPPDPTGSKMPDKYDKQEPTPVQPIENAIQEQPRFVLFRKPNKSVQRRKTITPDDKPPQPMRAYTNHQNELLIQNPMDANRFTVYPDIESYNRRLILPESRYKDAIDMKELTQVTIDPDNNMRKGKM